MRCFQLVAAVFVYLGRMGVGSGGYWKAWLQIQFPVSTQAYRQPALRDEWDLSSAAPVGLFQMGFWFQERCVRHNLHLTLPEIRQGIPESFSKLQPMFYCIWQYFPVWPSTFQYFYRCIVLLAISMGVGCQGIFISLYTMSSCVCLYSSQQNLGVG